ncbi:trypsin [Photorhabdus bodei]|uniref:Trypsin n=1 Tax=Photorhabdus bodei TaxID=2029681 RepID=A0ABX0AK77_9GAMM|nr:trypsin [Photorhabdus bodei]NDK97632.1 trypsin [Photorhabdus bodei]NDL01881.1 trypsin [Photorhabdus bodei]NDL05955.1 trypsin [Photorhabdus bodei]
MRKIFLATLITGIVSTSYFAHALPENNSEHIANLQDNTRNEAPLLKSTDPGAERFKHVGKLSGRGLCTATLIAGSETPDANQQALILSAGHCFDSSLDTNEVIIDQPVGPGWTYTPNYFIDLINEHQSVDVDRVLYATMKGGDLAVFRLKATYGELANRGILPVTLQKDYEPSALELTSQQIELAHIPVNGIESDKRYLRYSACNITGKASLVYEGIWAWSPAAAVNCAGVAGGTSGSPVMLKDQSKIIGVLNTTVDRSYWGCGLNRPCEFIIDHSSSRAGASYYMPIDKIARAFTSDGKLDLSKFDDGKGITINASGPLITKGTVNNKPVTWNLRLEEKGFDNIRYKRGLASKVDCTDPKGYSKPVPVTTQPLEKLTVPSKEGIYTMCVIGQHSANKRWQSTSNASIKLREIDNTLPGIRPDSTLLFETDDSWVIDLRFRPWEVVDIRYKAGPRKSTKCDDYKNYSTYRRVPITIKKKDSPIRFCMYGLDQAGNIGAIFFEDFGEQK